LRAQPFAPVSGRVPIRMQPRFADDRPFIRGEGVMSRPGETPSERRIGEQPRHLRGHRRIIVIGDEKTVRAIPKE
jgi:hypothetical protein